MDPRTWDDQDYFYNENEEVEHTEHSTQYPAPVSAHFNFNTEFTPVKLNRVLNEMLYSLAGSKMTLATLGVRLSLEYIVNDKEADGNTLFKKINSLHDKGYIDNDQKELLHQLRQRGNRSAHEAVAMSAKELVGGMSIIEGLLEKLYNGPARHAETMKTTKEILSVDQDSVDDLSLN